MSNKPVLTDEERIVKIECTSAGSQKPGHSGVSYPFHDLRLVETLDAADEWIKKNEHHPYVHVSLTIDITTKVYEGGIYKETRSTMRWHTYFIKDC